MRTNKEEKNDPRNIPLKDSLFLSPIEKYKIYGRFPWKLLIHLFLVIATTAQVNNYKLININMNIQIVLIIASTTQYTRAQERLFYNSFISDVNFKYNKLYLE
jgi:hypothetical protein